MGNDEMKLRKSYQGSCDIRFFCARRDAGSVYSRGLQGAWERAYEIDATHKNQFWNLLNREVDLTADKHRSGIPTRGRMFCFCFHLFDNAQRSMTLAKCTPAAPPAAGFPYPIARGQNKDR
jgi:hypothetical protein